MLVFPQLSTGALAQYPIGKRFSQRTILSATEDRTMVAMADPGANYLRWQIAFRNLSDQEAGLLSTFFTATQGNLRPFLFLDPAANLLLWSQDFSRNAWETTGLTFDVAVPDPMGGAGASRVYNQTATSLAIAQDTQIPGFVQTAFSVYLRGSGGGSAVLSRIAGIHSENLPVAVTAAWQRFCLSGSFPAVSDSSAFAIRVPAGTSLDVYGPQVDSQLAPSPYVSSAGSPGGVFTTARFDMDDLDILATGPNRNSCVVYVRCNLPLENHS